MVCRLRGPTSSSCNCLHEQGNLLIFLCACGLYPIGNMALFRCGYTLRKYIPVVWMHSVHYTINKCTYAQASFIGICTVGNLTADQADVANQLCSLHFLESLNCLTCLVDNGREVWLLATCPCPCPCMPMHCDDERALVYNSYMHSYSYIVVSS